LGSQQPNTGNPAVDDPQSAAGIHDRHRLLFAEMPERQTACRLEVLWNDDVRLAQELARLERRIAVFERIVTDPAVRLARENQALCLSLQCGHLDQH
jgi:hypothetical protein